MRVPTVSRSAALFSVACSFLLRARARSAEQNDVSAQRARSKQDAVTIHVHGWNLSGANKTGTVGDDRGGGSTVDGIRRFTAMPHGGSTSPTAQNQIIGTEYYGKVFLPPITPQPMSRKSLRSKESRAATIGCKYARYVMQRSGAEGGTSPVTRWAV